jgi:hypothetical protein
MKGRPRGLVALGIMFAALAACSSTPASTGTSPSSTTTSKAQSPTMPPLPSSSTTTADRAFPLVYSVGCPGEQPARTGPSEVVLSCADGNAYVSGITWSSWTATSAQGTGTLNLNNCIPDCAGGTFGKSATAVTLSSPVKTLTQGLVFGTVTWTTSSGSRSSEDIGPQGCTSDPTNRYC